MHYPKEFYLWVVNTHKNIKATARVGELNSSFRAFLSLAAFWRKVAPQIKKGKNIKEKMLKIVAASVALAGVAMSDSVPVVAPTYAPAPVYEAR